MTRKKQNIEIQNKLINHLVIKGKKSKSEKIVLESFKTLQLNSKKSSKKLFQLALISNTPIFKINSIEYNAYIKKLNKPLECSISKQIVLMLSLLVMFLLYIFNEDGIFNLTETICAPNDSDKAAIRKQFAKSAETNPNAVIPSSWWKFSSDENWKYQEWKALSNENFLILQLPRDKFLSLQAHHVKLKTCWKEDFIDFDLVPTRHISNNRDILNVVSPNYIPEIRHYKNLKSHEALQAEYEFLTTMVTLDPHIFENNYYKSTFNRFGVSYSVGSERLREYEQKFLDYLSEQLGHSNEKKKDLQNMYIAGRFWGKLLDFTSFLKTEDE